jgi:hypothetical protein
MGMGNHQGLIIDEDTGRNVAVAYDKADAPLIAAAPALLEALEIAVEVLRDHNLDELMAGEFEILTDAINQAKEEPK